MLASPPGSPPGPEALETSSESGLPLSIPSPKRISGRDNPEFKRFLAVRSRKNRDLILVEGPKLLEEAVRSKLTLDVVAFDDHVVSVSDGRLPACAPRLWVQFAGTLMRSLSDVSTHQGILTLVERPRFGRDWLTKKDAFLLVLDGLQDPGNVGTLLRTAEAAGITGVLLTRGCADPLSPKALRASAGSAFRLPHIPDLSPEGLLSLLPKGMRLAAAVADPKAVSAFGETPFAPPIALALGSEGSGLSRQIETAASVRIRVPSAARVESLNVAAAGAVLMFEIARRAGRLA